MVPIACLTDPHLTHDVSMTSSCLSPARISDGQQVGREWPGPLEAYNFPTRARRLYGSTPARPRYPARAVFTW
jgi:hypothetical protein